MTADKDEGASSEDNYSDDDDEVEETKEEEKKEKMLEEVKREPKPVKVSRKTVRQMARPATAQPRP